MALVYAPASAHREPSPVVFVFHGHGGRAENIARRMALHQIWAEAIVVYPQGLNTPGRITDPEGRLPGWQMTPGEQGDRDVAFHDAMLASFRRDYRVDESRIYATGHSNGGAFTYLLWFMRRTELAAFAPSGAAWPLALATTQPSGESATVLRPVMHIAGRADPLVKFAWQERTIDAVRRINGCGTGERVDERVTLYPSPAGAPVLTWIHPGGHAYPAEATQVVVRFFKEHAKPATRPAGEKPQRP